MHAVTALSFIATALFACSTPPAPLAEGASGDTSAGDTGGAPPTWTGQVAALYEQQCVECHYDGGIGPMPLDTYEDAAAWASASAAAVRARQMPPFNVNPDGSCQEFQDARWLTDEELSAFIEWAEAGAPKGDGDPPTLQPPDPVQLDQVDVTLSAGPDSTIDSDGETWRCYVTNTPGGSEQFIQGFRITPNDPSIVHHATVMALHSQESVDQALALDAETEEAGYACDGSVLVDTREYIGLYNPGVGTVYYPEGTGISYEPQYPSLVQVHYTGSGAGGLQVELDLTKDDVQEARILGFNVTHFALEPGQDVVSVTEELEMPGPQGSTMRLYAVNPHMHTHAVGQALILDPDGENTCLSRSPNYNTSFQQMHWYQEPIDIPADTPVSLTCHYSTLTDTEPVTAGPAYDNEMCVSQIYVVQDPE